MAVPKYDAIMLPLLKLSADGKMLRVAEAVDILAREFGLTEEDLRDILDSGESRFQNRVAWARTYLKKGGLVESPQRGYFQITARGRTVLEQEPDRIDAKFLKEFEEFRIWFDPPQKEGSKDIGIVPDDEKTPQEQLEQGHAQLRNDLAADLLERVKSNTPQFFEKLVVDLLVSLGYGGSWQDAAKVLGKSHDGGIDGLIKQDRLGLEVIYIQAKRWVETVGRPVVQAFAGSLEGEGASRGVLITTSSFSKQAQQYVTKIQKKIVLIDGQMLARLMIDGDLGVSKVASYEIKNLDIDYFSED